MDRKKKLLRYLPAAVGVVLTLAIAVTVYLLKDLFQKPVQSKKQVQQITIIQPPPPPPPPPEVKPPEPEPEPEKIEQPEPEPEPEQTPDEPPPGEELGVDADGAAGSDGFGLLGKKGGQGLIGGGGGSAIIWYGQQLQRQIGEELQEKLSQGKARDKKLSVIANIWIGSDGSVSRGELASSSGNGEVDEELRATLASLRTRFKAPPPNMPQPVKIRVRR
ncbi:MAG TPA: energy transducer TonB [Methylococcaceae bacterium]|nr:energy transducer TonB [Methylococcaceae bacterium]